MKSKLISICRPRWFAVVALMPAVALAPSHAFAQTGHVAPPATANAVISSRPILQTTFGRAPYWTDRRLANAKPATTPIITRRTTASSRTLSAEATGPAGSVAPTGPKGSTPLAGVPQTQGAPIELAASTVSRPYTDFPDKTNGKVFFTAADGGDFVCSGTAINSRSKSVVWTAGHCVHAGDGHGQASFHTNWVFIPGYSSSYTGQRPYGTWSASQLSTVTQWADNGNQRYDIGAATVYPYRGELLTDKVGGQGIAWNYPREQTWNAYGYPAVAPFTGNDQYRCPSKRRDDDLPPGSGPATLEINCNMTAGSSGGGWLFRSTSTGLAYLNGVNSYRYADTPDAMYGPYFGDSARDLYNYVQGPK